MSETADPERDPAAVTKFIERFASALVDAGVPRMPARAFVALLATDSGRLTAAELADVLQSSPAAISGAVRYLAQVGMVTREREPGSRRDHVVVHDDMWYEMLVRRDRALRQWEDSLRDGVAALGKDTPGGARVAETLALIEFLHVELAGSLARWRERRDQRRAERAQDR